MPRRKTTPGVKDGKVRKKNRWAVTPGYWNTPQKIPVIDRENPGDGFKHFLRKRDVVSFIELLPDWDELSMGLDAILLARGEDGGEGWIQAGVVAICAWPKEEWIQMDSEHFGMNRDALRRLGVECVKQGDVYECRFDPAAIRAYQLLSVLLHELGHHHDRMTTKKKRYVSRGETYAEQYAKAYGRKIWDDYLAKFGVL
jgi:hypothetical protein